MELLADNRVILAGIYNAGGVSVAAALATLDVLEREPIYERLRALGTQLRDGLVEMAVRHGLRLVAAGPGPVFFTWLLAEGEVRTLRDHLRADFASYARFAEYMIVRVIAGGRWYLNAAHTSDDVAAALAAADRAFARLAATG